MISIDDFKKVEMRVGRIVSAEKLSDTDKLLKLSVDFGALPDGAGVRQVLSGIALSYPDPTALAERKFAFVTNLEPRMIRGLESQAMILAVGEADSIILFDLPATVPEGSIVR